MSLHVFIPFFVQPTDPPSREEGRWEMKHFIGMAYTAERQVQVVKEPQSLYCFE